MKRKKKKLKKNKSKKSKRFKSRKSTKKRNKVSKRKLKIKRSVKKRRKKIKIRKKRIITSRSKHKKTQKTRALVSGILSLSDKIKSILRFKFNLDKLLQNFENTENECKSLLEKKLSLPAYDQCLKASHIFNLLDARGVIGVAERTGYITRIRELAKGCGALWLSTQS